MTMATANAATRAVVLGVYVASVSGFSSLPDFVPRIAQRHPMRQHVHVAPLARPSSGGPGLLSLQMSAQPTKKIVGEIAHRPCGAWWTHVAKKLVALVTALFIGTFAPQSALAHEASYSPDSADASCSLIQRAPSQVTTVTWHPQQTANLAPEDGDARPALISRMPSQVTTVTWSAEGSDSVEPTVQVTTVTWGQPPALGSAEGTVVASPVTAPGHPIQAKQESPGSSEPLTLPPLSRTPSVVTWGSGIGDVGGSESGGGGRRGDGLLVRTMAAVTSAAALVAFDVACHGQASSLVAQHWAKLADAVASVATTGGSADALATGAKEGASTDVEEQEARAYAAAVEVAGRDLGFENNVASRNPEAVRAWELLLMLSGTVPTEEVAAAGKALGLEPREAACRQMTTSGVVTAVASGAGLVCISIWSALASRARRISAALDARQQPKAAQKQAHSAQDVSQASGHAPMPLHPAREYSGNSSPHAVPDEDQGILALIRHRLRANPGAARKQKAEPLVASLIRHRHYPKSDAGAVWARIRGKARSIMQRGRELIDLAWP